jgi:hypothetical protein
VFVESEKIASRNRTTIFDDFDRSLSDSYRENNINNEDLVAFASGEGPVG